MIGRSERFALKSLRPGSLLRNASALALLAALTGCRDSAKTSASNSASSQGSSSRVQQPAPVAPKPAPPSVKTPKAIPTHEPPPPPMDNMVPVKTFEIQPPAAFTADQLPKDEAVEFHFAGRAGQMLRVRVGSYRVRIQPLGGGSPLNHGWDSAGNWFYGLPETGTYRVLYAPWHTTPGIKFEFLPDNDRWPTRVSNPSRSLSISARLPKIRNS